MNVIIRRETGVAEKLQDSAATIVAAEQKSRYRLASPPTVFLPEVGPRPPSSLSSNQSSWRLPQFSSHGISFPRRQRRLHDGEEQGVSYILPGCCHSELVSFTKEEKRRGKSIGGLLCGISMSRLHRFLYWTDEKCRGRGHFLSKLVVQAYVPCIGSPTRTCSACVC